MELPPTQLFILSTTMVITRPITPTEEEDNPDACQKPTPIKNKLRMVTKFCQDQNLDIHQTAIFSWAGVPPRTGYRYLQPNQGSRRHANDPYTTEKRGRKRLIQDSDFTALEDWILHGGFNHRVCNYIEVWIEVFPHRDLPCDNTLRKAFQDRGYHKCIACQKPFLTEKSIRERHSYLNIRRFWTLDQWRTVRFSDECHFGLGPRRKLKVIRRRGERYHDDCIQKTFKSKNIQHKNEKRWHVWAAIGYNFKSKLVFYESSSSNGKMTGKIYIDRVLSEVQNWIDNGQKFILEEDQDSAHGVGKDSQVRKYKEQMGLQYFFNASGSPDLAPIENIWRAQKQKINDIDHFSDDALVEAIYRAWAEIDQGAINRYVDSMVRRMDSLHHRNGDITEF